MVLAGGVRSRKLDLDAFIRQANDYEEWSSGWDKLNRMRSELSLTHSRPVRRVKEITEWVQSGEYDRIVAGEYPTRDQQADARKEAGEAYELYKERFRGSSASSAARTWREGRRGAGEGRRRGREGRRLAQAAAATTRSSGRWRPPTRTSTTTATPTRTRRRPTPTAAGWASRSG